MGLQIHRINAASFTPIAGARISLSGDHLICDDCLLKSGLIQCDSLAQRTDGDFRAIRQNDDDIYKVPNDLSSVSFVTLSDNDVNNKYGMCKTL